MSVSEERAQVEALIAQASEALSEAQAGNITVFLEKADRYLEALDRWQAEVKARSEPLTASVSSEEEKALLRSAVEQLAEAHRRLLELSTGAREEVSQQMNDLHRRASGLKKYVEGYQGRVTIAGHRKG